MQQLIYNAATYALTHIGRTNGGRLPTTLDGTLELPYAYGVADVILHASATSLVIDVDGSAVILIDSRSSPLDQMCGAVHEIVEFMQIDDGYAPALADALRPGRYHQSGGDDPEAIRHQIAVLAEQIYRVWLMM
jgi:hypothetical protein